VAKKIATNVVGIHEETGETRWFHKGDTVPGEYQKSISNPAAYEGGDEPPSDEPPGDKPPSDEPPGEDEDLIGEEDEPEDNYESSEATNDDLRAELARRDLPVHGNKPDLVARLRADDAENG